MSTVPIGLLFAVHALTLPPLVLVPAPADEVGCVAHARAAALIGHAGGVRVVRLGGDDASGGAEAAAPESPRDAGSSSGRDAGVESARASLERARAAVGADFAFSATCFSRGDSAGAKVLFARAGKPVIEREVLRPLPPPMPTAAPPTGDDPPPTRPRWTPPGRRAGPGRDAGLVSADGGSAPDAPALPSCDGAPVEEALRAVWPDDAPALPSTLFSSAANATSLAAACRGDAAGAYTAAGAAVGRLIPSKVSAPATLAKGSLLERWAHASTLRAAGDCRKAGPILDGVVSALAKGALAPVWRRPPPPPGMDRSSVQLLGPHGIVTLEAITLPRSEQNLGASPGVALVAFDAATGDVRWRHPLGAASPSLVPVGDDRVLLVLENELVALEPRSGRILWRTPLSSPGPEVLVTPTRLFVSGGSEVIAVDPRSGEVVWRHDPLNEVIAGPTLVAGQVAVPNGAFIDLLDPADGHRVRRVDLDDEIAAPLIATPLGMLWALAGSDEIVAVDPQSGAQRVRVKSLPSPRFPPAVLSEQLVVLAGTRDRDLVLAYLDPDAKNGVRRTIRGALPPLVPLPDFSGLLHLEAGGRMLIARDLAGEVLWRQRASHPIRAVSVEGDFAVAAAGPEVLVFDRRKGSLLHTIGADGPVREVVFGPKGGALLLEDGTLYGLPEGHDPRPRAWLEDARLELAACHVAMSRTSDALKLARDVLLRDPNDLDALALVARAQSKPAPAESAAAWAKLWARTPRGDPIRAEAASELLRLAGVTARIPPEPPIRDVVTTERAVVTLENGSAVARALPEASTDLWRKKAAAISLVGEDLIAIEPPNGGVREVVSVADGSAVKPPAGQAERIGRAAFVRTKEGRALVRLDAKGAARWTLTLDRGDLVLREVAEGRVLLGAETPEGLLVAVDAENGTRRWMVPLGEPVRGAWSSEQRVLVKTDRTWWVLDAENGAKRSELRLPNVSVDHVRAVPGGWALFGGRQLRIVEAARARVKSTVTLPSPIVELGVVEAVPEMTIARLERGDLLAIDTTRGTLRGHVDLGPLTKLVFGRDRVVALDADGALWIIDPARGLRAP